MIAVPLLGIAVSYLFFMSKTFPVEKLMASALAGSFTHSGLAAGASIPCITSISPFLFSRVNRKDIIDSFYALIVSFRVTLQRAHR